MIGAICDTWLGAPIISKNPGPSKVPAPCIHPIDNNIAPRLKNKSLDVLLLEFNRNPKVNIPNGTTSGQKLTLVIEGNMGAGNSVPIMLAGNLIGAFDMFMPGAKTSLYLVYYSTASISAW